MEKPGRCQTLYRTSFDTDLRRLYDARLMLDSLPATFDPIQLADEGVRLVGTLPLRGMKRLSGLCVNDQTEAYIDFQFQRSLQGEREMHGTVTATVELECQRCLQSVQLKLEAQPLFLFVRPGQMGEGVTDEADIIEVGKPLVLNEFVEDELLLAMPMVPLHPETECQPAAGAPGEGKPNPFAALSQLKKSEKKF